MKWRFPLLFLMLTIAAGLAFGAWQWMERRTVDCRSGSEWLAFAERAAMETTYHANGHSVVDGKQAGFQLDQGAGGRYAMRVTDSAGRVCNYGSDGETAWYRTRETAETAEAGCCRTAPPPRGRVTGTGMVAERPVVLLSVRSGPLMKILAVDRETGVILSMRTRFRNKIVSEMTVDNIDYRAVEPRREAADIPAKLRHADMAELTRLLKNHRPLEPRWLPKGFTHVPATYRDMCPCCGTELAVLRYTDGLATITVFEMYGHMMCAMEAGCHMAPSEGALIETRKVGDFTVAVVGDVSARDLQRVVKSLRHR